MKALVTPDPWSELRRCTPARIALGRAGDSLPTGPLLEFGVAHAAARDAVHRALDEALLRARLEPISKATLTVRSAALDRQIYLRRPDLGRRLDASSRTALGAMSLPVEPDLVLVIADGLSACAPERHAPELIEAIVRELPELQIAPLVIAHQARVALGDEIGEIWGARFVAMLIGERPGLSSPDSLGIYLTFAPRRGCTDAQRNCISNIRPEGLSTAAAARKFAYLVREATRIGATGVQLKDDSDAAVPLTEAEPHALPEPARVQPA